MTGSLHLLLFELADSPLYAEKKCKQSQPDHPGNDTDNVECVVFEKVHTRIQLGLFRSLRFKPKYACEDILHPKEHKEK